MSQAINLSNNQAIRSLVKLQMPDFASRMRAQLCHDEHVLVFGMIAQD